MRISRYVAGLAALGVAAATAFFPGRAAQAQSFTFSSSFQVQNLSSTGANISISFFKLNEANAQTSVTDTIAGSGQKTYATLPSQVEAGFDGSAVIASDQRVAAIVNVNSPDLSLSFGGEAYVGVTEGSNSVSLPLLFKGSFGFNSFFNVQNVGQTATQVTVTYSGGGLSAPVTVPAVTVNPGSAARFDVGGNANLPAGFNGAATIASSASDIAAVATHVGPSTVLIYNGFASGTTNPVFPLVNVNNFGYQTGIALQNRGGQASNVTVTYTANGATTPTCTETLSIPGNGGSAFFAISAFGANDANTTNNCPNGATFVGSARVSANSANVELVGTVDQLNSGQRKGGTYSGFSEADATGTVVFPLINDRNFGFFTGISLANVTDTAATVTCTYSGTTYRDENKALPARGTLTIVNANLIGNGYNGSGTCTVTGGARIVGVANQLRTSPNSAGQQVDTFYVYEGSNN
jgi:hypothetical protein